jgi:hypothetical protein
MIILLNKRMLELERPIRIVVFTISGPVSAHDIPYVLQLPPSFKKPILAFNYM